MPAGCARVRKSLTEQRMLALLNFIDYLKKVNSNQFGKTRTSEVKHVRAERRKNWGSNPNKGTVFSLLQSLQTGFGAHPNS